MTVSPMARYLIVKDALSSAEVAGLAAAGDDLADYASPKWQSEYTSGSPDRVGGRNIFAADLGSFLPLLAHPKTLPLVVGLG